MGVLKRKVNSKAKGFTPYSGPDPKPGTYRARVVKGAIRAASTGTLSYNVLVEFVATKPEHKKYDGFDTFCEIWLGEKEASQAKEAAFIKAITGKDNFQNVNVAYTGKEEDFNTASGAEITGLDGVKLPNKIVNVYMRTEKASTGDDGKEYPARLRADSILPWSKDDDADEDAEDDIDQIEDGDVDDEDDTEVEDDAEEDGDEETEEMSDEEWEQAKEARRVELKSREYDLAKLRAVLKENGIDTKGLKKPELVEAIIGLEFPDEDGEDEEGIDESDVEVEESAEAESEESEEDDDEEEEDDEEDEEEEEEEEGDDLRTEIEAEAASLDRSGLKKAIKALDADAGFKKVETDDDLRERFVELKLNAPGF